MAKNIRMTIAPDRRAELMKAVDWERVNAMTEEEIEADIASDPGAVTFSDAELVAIRVQYVRKRTGLSQPEFAKRFRIPLGTLRDWEQARSAPDAAALAYLKVIEHNPDAVVHALETAA